MSSQGLPRRWPTRPSRRGEAAVNAEHKISSSHRERTAIIYLRQSSMAQVREHTESTRSQYALADKAAALGWARSEIEVMERDLGSAGKGGVARAGFTELVTRVCGGDVGAIFGIEITRLARSNADVARLAEFARITGTLLIDPDGVYDPADVNDRVLLGFKGTMGEMELHVMAQRLHANKRAAAERGELRTPLPVGLVHDDAGDVVIDPDAEVQAAVRDVFAAFAACGSAYGVVAAFPRRRFPLRASGGARAAPRAWWGPSSARAPPAAPAGLRPAAGRAPRPRSTALSGGCCWTRSPPGRSPWRCRQPMRWPAGTSGSAGPPSSPSNGPATTPAGPSAPSARLSRRTGWSPAAWKPAGRPGSPPSPRPSRHWRQPMTRCRLCPAGLSWRNSPPTCPASGTPQQPATRTASGCCAH